MKKKTRMRSKKNARKTKRIRGGALEPTLSKLRNFGSSIKQSLGLSKSVQKVSKTIEIQNLENKNEALKNAKKELHEAIKTKSDPSNDDTPEIESLRLKLKKAEEEQKKAYKTYIESSHKRIRQNYTSDELSNVFRRRPGASRVQTFKPSAQASNR